MWFPPPSTDSTDRKQSNHEAECSRGEGHRSFVFGIHSLRSRPSQAQPDKWSEGKRGEEERRRPRGRFLSVWAREQIKSALKSSFRCGSPHRKHTSCLLLITSAHLASLPAALPPHGYLATRSTTSEQLTNVVTTVPPSLEDLLFHPFNWHVSEPGSAFSSQSFHLCMSLMKTAEEEEATDGGTQLSWKCDSRTRRTLWGGVWHPKV